MRFKGIWEKLGLAEQKNQTIGHRDVKEKGK